MTIDSIHFRATSTSPVDLGSGLVMRWSTKDDTANICALIGESFKVGHIVQKAEDVMLWLAVLI